MTKVPAWALPNPKDRLRPSKSRKPGSKPGMTKIERQRKRMEKLAAMTTAERSAFLAKEAEKQCPTEHEEQCDLIKWFDLTYPQWSGRLAAVPNASMVPAHVGDKLNQEGRRKGYPDLQLLMWSAGYPGLIIEMKRVRGGTVSAEQKVALAWMAEEGYRAEVCKGAEAAKAVITEYLAPRLALLAV